MNHRLRLIHAVAEAIIPLMGLFFFDWGLYFILLFYFIDLLASEVFSYIKVNKIIQFQRINFPFKLKYGRLALNSLIVVAAILIAHFAVLFIVPNIHFTSEFIAFLKYEEKGFPIPQGYILLPLVIIGNLQQYKMMFVKNGLFQRTSWKQLILVRRKALLTALLGGMVCIPIAFFIPIPEYVYVFAIIIVKFLIDWYWSID